MAATPKPPIVKSQPPRLGGHKPIHNLKQFAHPPKKAKPGGY